MEFHFLCQDSLYKFFVLLQDKGLHVLKLTISLSPCIPTGAWIFLLRPPKNYAANYTKDVANFLFGNILYLLFPPRRRYRTTMPKSNGRFCFPLSGIENIDLYCPKCWN